MSLSPHTVAHAAFQHASEQFTHGFHASERILLLFFQKCQIRGTQFSPEGGYSICRYHRLENGYKAPSSSVYSFQLSARKSKPAVFAATTTAATMTARRGSAIQHNNAIQERAASVAQEASGQQSWLERKLKPSKITARYPKAIRGKKLLFATCGFGSLGDALFGYNSGMYQ